mmetsp:Transcript_4020/g.5917  ORF Transcript_4020/g.5917 Transcript_4020/m.5917 type:complete len:274 (-) Transcript_4020:487-1308(-)
MDTELDVFGKGLVELFVCVLVLSEIVEHLNAFLHKVFLNDTKNLVLLKSFTRNVERKIFRVYNSLDELQPFRHEVFTVIHDKHTSDIQLDVIKLLLVTPLEHVKWSALWAEENGTELQLSLHREMLDGCMFFPIIGDRLVKCNIFVLRDFVRFTHPDWFCVVEVFPLMTDLLDLLHSLLLLSVFLINFFNLWLIIIAFLLIVVIIIFHFLLSCLFCVQFDWESDELGVLLHKILDSLFLEIFRHIFFQVKDDAGTTSHSVLIILCDGERTTSF